MSGATATDLTIDVRPDEGFTTVAVGGEIDLSTAPRLREQLHELIDAGSARLVIDLQAVRFLDSTALGVLIGALRAARERGGDTHLVCGPGRVAKVLEITRLDQAFDIFTDPAAAQHFGG